MKSSRRDHYNNNFTKKISTLLHLYLMCTYFYEMKKIFITWMEEVKKIFCYNLALLPLKLVAFYSMVTTSSEKLKKTVL